MFRQPVVEAARCGQLWQVALDNSKAQDILINAHLHVDLSQGFWAQCEIQLPDVCLRVVCDVGSRQAAGSSSSV